MVNRNMIATKERLESQSSLTIQNQAPVVRHGGEGVVRLFRIDTGLQHRVCFFLIRHKRRSVFALPMSRRHFHTSGKSHHDLEHGPGGDRQFVALNGLYIKFARNGRFRYEDKIAVSKFDSRPKYQ